MVTDEQVQSLMAQLQVLEQRNAELATRVQKLENMEAVLGYGGDFLRMGADVSDPDKTSLAIALVEAEYNGETIGAGNVLIGSNSAGIANFLVERSTGQIFMRHGQVTVPYVDVDGSFVVAGGDVKLNDDGLTMTYGGAFDKNSIKIVHDGIKVARMYVIDATPVHETHLHAIGWNNTSHEAWLYLEAVTDDNLAHADTNSVRIILKTDVDRADVFAGMLKLTGGLTHNSPTLLTTTVALTNGAAAQVGTLNNAPAAGNPTKWIPVDDNGTVRYLPAW